jgi:hypothetical protein
MLDEKFLKLGFTLLFIFFPLLSPLPLQGGNTLSVEELLSHPNRYNNQEITVKGKVSDIQITTNKIGKEYTIFRLTDEKGKTIKIFNLGALVPDSQKVVVTGIYRKVMKVDGSTFRNEIEAKKIN